MSQKSSVKITVVDDHSLFRKGIVTLIQEINSRFKVVAEAGNGAELLDQLEAGLECDLIVLDLDMPIMDGLQTTQALKERFPKLGILMLTMKNDESSLIRLLKAGVNGYLTKDVEPDVLEKALLSIYEHGYYYTDALTGKLVQALQSDGSVQQSLNDQELKFLELACSEMTYKEIADKMCLSEKTIDGCRAKLFDKLSVKSRVGLVLFAVKNELISL